MALNRPSQGCVSIIGKAKSKGQSVLALFNLSWDCAWLKSNFSLDTSRNDRESGMTEEWIKTCATLFLAETNTTL